MWRVRLIWMVAFPMLLSASTSKNAFSGMPFPEAAEPYVNAVYCFDGYVDPQGAIRNEGLGCSGYAVAVLYRMRDGERWLKVYQADWAKKLRPHQWHGFKIAAHFGQEQHTSLSRAELASTSQIKSRLERGTLKPGLYFFNVRKDSAGHVGFVRVRKDGTLVQSHYSGMRQYNGLATGAFGDWYAKSQYHGKPVDLYFIGL